MGKLSLDSGAWHAEVLPEAGGLIAALSLAGVPVLRSMAEGAEGPLAAASFPMVPWCNRIAGACFDWGGAGVNLARNFLPEPHAIHGHGWQAAWAVESRTGTSCVLVHRHDGAAPGWPWAYAARQEIALSQAGCAITLSLTNLAGCAAPVGLGLHPYLRRRPETRVRFQAQSVVAVGADQIPTGARLPAAHFADFSAGAGLPAGLIDHCFIGWDRAAEVTDDCGTITLAARGAGALHVYAPPGGDVLCLEPVSHLPDAINAGAMPLCGPGETLRLSLLIGAG